jgi:acetylglutamate kinase
MRPLVVKIGGSTQGSGDTTLEDLVTLQQRGIIPVVVHGGGNVISRWMERSNTLPRFVRGLRVTDASTLEVW